MTRPVPLCNRCGKRHFNFKSCDEAARDARQPTVALHPKLVEEGWREFGDRLSDSDRGFIRGELVVLPAREPRRSGRPLTSEQPPEAA